MASFRQKLKELFPISVKGFLILALSLVMASFICIMLMMVADSDVHVPMIFVLAVLVVSLLTDGYFYGIIAAAVSVIGVNYAFTYPYLKLDFSIYGYPLTFMTMLAVGIAVSTLTGRLKAQEKIKAESEREKMRANLLRAVSHDLRTPLTAISGSITTVLENGEYLTEGQKRELLTDARGDAEWLYRMVENLLSVTRIGSDGKGSLNTTDELLEDVLGEAVLKFRKRNNTVEVSVCVPDELILVPVDAMLIEQVLLNLMDNAVIHGKGADMINVSASTDGKCAIVRVEDNGAGISREVMPKLFDGSLKLSAQNGDSARSMGIGLSVCKTIIEAHGGRIWAENIPESGARFSFTLPVSEHSI